MSKGKMLKKGYELKDGVTLFLRHKAQKQLLETLKDQQSLMSLQDVLEGFMFTQLKLQGVTPSIAT